MFHYRGQYCSFQYKNIFEYFPFPNCTLVNMWTTQNVMYNAYIIEETGGAAQP